MRWEVIDLGRLPYEPALSLQRQRNLAVSQGDADEALLLVEHGPVITLIQRRGIREHVLASSDRLKQLGIEVQATDRGGDVTYHGPGQLVAYPIVRLQDHGLNLGRYMRLLEAAVIDTLGYFDIGGQAETGATGVWVPLATGGNPSATTAKVCAMGVRVRKNTTMHGLALNVTTDLSHFQTIDPCGLGGRPVTSLFQLLGDRCPTMEAVKLQLTRDLARHLDAATDRSTAARSATEAGQRL